MTKNISANHYLMVISDKPDSFWSTIVNEALVPLGKLRFFSEKKALAQVRKHTYDLIIIASGDIEGDVVALVQRLKILCPKTPVVVTTNSPTWHRAREVFLAGATDYTRRTLNKDQNLSFFKKILT